MEDKVSKIDFETKIKNAQELLKELSNPEITLEKSVEVYKKGLKELESASMLLENAKLEFETLSNKI